MTLVDPRPLLATARRNGYGVGAFNVTLLEHAEAIVAGAEAAGAPLIMQISENAVRYHNALRPIALASLDIARSAAVPVAVHLDHAADIALIREAVDLGLTSVMYDGSTLPDDQNREWTSRVVAHCHAQDVAVEAELGVIGGKDGVHAPQARTDPGDARQFVADTGVDSLAVAVGSSHAMSSRDAVIDIDLVATLASTVDVPLVLHGSSGVPDETLSLIVRSGLTKVNIATHLNRVFTQSIRDTFHVDQTLLDARKYIDPAREAMAVEVTRILEVLGARDTADLA